LAVGIVLCIFIEVLGTSKEYRRQQVEEGIEIYNSTVRADLADLDARKAAKKA
jgi:hypothetical protein